MRVSFEFSVRVASLHDHVIFTVSDTERFSFRAGLSGNWIEIAYGTKSGSVRVIVQHPETVGHGPQLFQTFTVHQSPVTKVTLSEKFLISVCSEYNHVRTWQVTRFRGMISTQPGSTPEASFKVGCVGVGLFELLYKLSWFRSRLYRWKRSTRR